LKGEYTTPIGLYVTSFIRFPASWSFRREIMNLDLSENKETKRRTLKAKP
jgi:hypothetical protein